MEIDVQLLKTGISDYAKVGRFKELVDEVKKAGWLLKLVKAYELGAFTVAIAEQVSNDMSDIHGGNGAQKKEAVTSFLDELVKLPFFLEPVDGYFFGLLVDWLVSRWNASHTHDWLQKAKDFLGID